MLSVVLHPEHPPVFYKDKTPGDAQTEWLGSFRDQAAAALAAEKVEAREIKSLDQLLDFCPDDSFMLVEDGGS